MGLRAGRESHDLSAVASLPKVSPLAINAPRPEYPAEVRQKHIGGTGYFVIRVDRATGAVATVEVRRSANTKAVAIRGRWRTPDKARAKLF